MDKNIYELYDPDEPNLKQYYKEYRLWLKDFEKTDEFNKMVVDYESDWIKYIKNLLGSLNTKFGCRSMVTG